MQATTGYAKSDGAHLAYSVLGEGPRTIMYLSTYTISIDSLDDEPHVAHYFRRLASFARLVRTDIRGVGLSDPVDNARPFTVDTVASDVEAVLDAVGASTVTLVADSGGCPIAIALAAARPERVEALVLVNSYARVAADDGYWGIAQEMLDAFLQTNFDPTTSWSLDGADDLALIAPTMRNDTRFVEWWKRVGNRGASPASAQTLISMTTLADVRDRLAAVQAPTLVLHRRGNLFIPAPLGRYVAEHIANARLVELPGNDHGPWTGGADEILDEIEEFLTGRRTGGERFLATVLFTDIVDSTGRAAALGDKQWSTYLDTHDSIVRAELQRYGGREVNTTGDGFFGTFDSPTQAVRCAQAIVSTLAAKDIAVRVGLHTGECERRDRDVAGLAVHIAARVAALAASGEVLVSRTVRDLVTGSGFRFLDRGEHELKGVPETWHLFTLDV